MDRRRLSLGLIATLSMGFAGLSATSTAKAAIKRAKPEQKTAILLTNAIWT